MKVISRGSFFAAAVLVVLAVLLPACSAEKSAVQRGEAQPPDRGTCAAEAEMLAEPVTVHAAPEASSPQMTRLDKGHFVYRCERRGEWLALMFPRTRGEKTDCSLRRRDPQCSMGWVRGNLVTELFG
jgi:hypothetical protein